jgi:hypothetical protein
MQSEQRRQRRRERKRLKREERRQALQDADPSIFEWIELRSMFSPQRSDRTCARCAEIVRRADVRVRPT